MSLNRIAGYLSMKEIPYRITNTNPIEISPIEKDSLRLLNAKERCQLQEQISHFLCVACPLEDDRYKRALELGEVVFVTFFNGSSSAEKSQAESVQGR